MTITSELEPDTRTEIHRGDAALIAVAVGSLAVGEAFASGSTGAYVSAAIAALTGIAAIFRLCRSDQAPH